MEHLAVTLAGHHPVTSARYDGIVRSFKDAGYRSLLYEPNWNTSTVNGLIDDFLSFLPKKYESLTFLGFSLGGMIALIAASRIDVKNLILCSPSGYFTEYVPLLGTDDLDFAGNQLKGFQDISAQDILARAKVGSGRIIYGEIEYAEWPDFKQWIDDLRHTTMWNTGVVTGVGHEIEHPNYQKTISEAVRDMSQ